MEIYALLIKPFTKEQMDKFIDEFNTKQGMLITETEQALEAWKDTEEL